MSNPNTYSDKLAQLEKRVVKSNYLTVGKNADGVPVVAQCVSRLAAMNAYKAAVTQFGQTEVHIYKLVDGKYNYDMQSVSEASGNKKGADHETKIMQQSLYTLKEFIHSLAVAKNFTPDARREMVEAFCTAYAAIGGSTSELVSIIDSIESEGSVEL